MAFVKGLLKAAAGASAGVAVITALPIFGAVGTITAVGAAIGSVLGAAAGVADEVVERRKERARGGGGRDIEPQR